ncbi:MAG: VanZ family protein [Clostridia bacterium]|nr:VanZ family protein [Clostridia bacterium]
MEKRTDKKRTFFRILLTVLCVCVYAFIFYNSAQTEAASASQSGAVTDAVQDVAGVVAPESSVATATGKAYEELHSIIRTIAHFAEFALLGALLIWCCFSYTDRAFFFIIPLAMILVTPLADETIQLFASGRVADVKDVLTDIAGGYLGALFATFTIWIGLLIKNAKRGIHYKRR